MNATLAPPAQLLQWPLVRTAAKVFRRGPAVTVRHWRKRGLRAAYLLGSATPGRVQEEQADPGIVEEGRVLRQRLLELNERRHAAAGYRVLMLRPGSITAEIWFGDLQRCLQHAGIDCHVLPPGTATAAINAAFEEFQPNVFVATEATEDLRALDLPFIFRYKNTRGCLRLLVPVWHADIPRAWVPGTRSTPQLDEWRRRLRWEGLTADAHFSIFEAEFHERFARDPAGPAIDYVSIPQACNPFVDYPLAASKRHDYFMAASMTDDRVDVARRYLRPVLARYRGLWAGPQWGFGTERIPPADMPLRYAQSRIALSPLVAFVQVYAAELTHRVYAAAGCGAFQLTTPTAITGRYFRPDELVQAASPTEFLQLFDHYVERPLERNAIALAALRRAYAEHTCFHRIDKLVHHLDEWRRRGLF
jgi:hypothetical protein